MYHLRPLLELEKLEQKRGAGASGSMKLPTIKSLRRICKRDRPQAHANSMNGPQQECACESFLGRRGSALRHGSHRHGSLPFQELEKVKMPREAHGRILSNLPVFLSPIGSLLGAGVLTEGGALSHAILSPWLCSGSSSTRDTSALAPAEVARSDFCPTAPSSDARIGNILRSACR